MTSPNLKGRRKQKITYTASVEGIKTAEKALKRLGFESKSNFSKSQLISRSTVTKFFQRQPIQLDSFKRICEGLKLNNWKEIAELEPSKTIDCNRTAINEGGKVEMTNCRQIIVIDKESKIVKAQIILEGDINSVNNDLRLTLELCLRKYPEDDIRITNIESGSIKLTIEGSQESVEKLVELIKSGELTEVNGFPVKDIQIENPLGNESDVDKWSLVQEIRRQGARNRKLISVDLSDADLRGADLRGADLSGADLSYADLSGADLSGADLSYADLSGADLSGADLSYADLSGADLSGADLFGADLSGTNFIDADLSGVYFGVIRWGRDEKSYITILERRDGESVVSIGNLGGQYQLPTKMREQQKRRAPKAVPQSAVARWSFPPWIRRFFRWLRAVER